MTNCESLSQSLNDAVRYLISTQIQDGHWQEYKLPVGSSDAWITAYVGFALAEICRLRGPCESESQILLSARKAASWLQKNRAYEAGWGFNAHTGPDADSTGWVLRLFHAVGDVVEARDVNFLLSQKSQEGGFATYPGPGNWGTAHPDVTPVVFLGLPQDAQAEVEKDVLSYLASIRSDDGTWPSYWWRTSHYATFQNVELFFILGNEDSMVLPIISDEMTHSLHSAFDLACTLGVAVIRGAPSRLIRALCGELLSLQAEDGRWPGADNLRVTDPSCPQPWIQPAGKYYTDTAGLITTATAVRALGYILRKITNV